MQNVDTVIMLFLAEGYQRKLCFLLFLKHGVTKTREKSGLHRLKGLVFVVPVLAGNRSASAAQLRGIVARGCSCSEDPPEGQQFFERNAPPVIWQKPDLHYRRRISADL